MRTRLLTERLLGGALDIGPCRGSGAVRVEDRADPALEAERDAAREHGLARVLDRERLAKEVAMEVDRTDREPTAVDHLGLHRIELLGEELRVARRIEERIGRGRPRDRQAERVEEAVDADAATLEERLDVVGAAEADDLAHAEAPLALE